MPVYEYLCDRCGPFEELVPLARFSDPADCPGCGTAAPRTILSAPRFAAMAASRRAAFETNERSAHEPRLSTKAERESSHVHGPGCGCGTSKGAGKGRGRTVQGKDGSKSFPSARPWMISH